MCELFAGVGGFRLGLQESGWKTVWMNQWEPSKKRQDAFHCYCTHFGKEDFYINQDIATIDKETIPEHTLLVGGFPCQDYSVAKTGAQGIEGKKGVLWWQIREVLQKKKPPFVLLENVDRLLRSPVKQIGRDFCIMLSCFWALGYYVEWRVINAADYGFPQRRKRVFIFAYLSNTKYAKRLEKNFCVGKSIFEGKGLFSQAFSVEIFGSMFMTRLASKNPFAFMDGLPIKIYPAGIMQDGDIVMTNILPKYDGKKKTLQDVLENNVDEHFFVKEEDVAKWAYCKGSKKIERISKNGHAYLYSEGAVPFPDEVGRPSRTILTSEGNINRSSHIIKDSQKLRILTPKECERLQGFPDDWTNTGMSERSRYFCMGNSLVVGIIKQLGRIIGGIADAE